jgi:hypothetical protein
MRRLLRESGVPALYLSWSFGVPAIYLGLPFRRSWPSHGGGPLTVAFRQVIYPAGLTALLQAVITFGPPEAPVALS